MNGKWKKNQQVHEHFNIMEQELAVLRLGDDDDDINLLLECVIPPFRPFHNCLMLLIGRELWMLAFQ